MINFKDFVVRNGIITTAAGIAIGISSTLFIKNTTHDIILPLTFFIFVKWIKYFSPATEHWLRQGFTNTKFLWAKFFQELLTWVFMTLMAFIILEYFVRRYLLSQLATQHNVTTEEAEPLPPIVHMPTFVQNMFPVE